MDEVSSRSPLWSPLGRTTLLHDGAAQGDNGTDVEDIFFTDWYRVPAAPLATVDDWARELGESLELIPLQDTGPEDDDTRQRHYSSPGGGSPESMESCSVLLTTGRTSNFKWHMEKHGQKYALLALLIMFIALIYPVLTLYGSLPLTDSHAVEPKRPSHTPVFRPWRERKGNNQLPRILLWNNTGVHKWWGPYKVMCATEGRNLVMCKIIENRHWVRSSDAVVVLAEHLECPLIADFRSPLQFWVFWDKGSSIPQGDGAHGNDSCSLSHVADAFNWTMSYRDDADVVVPYNTWRCDFAMIAKQPNGTVTPKKRGDIAWIVGSCEQRRFLEQVRRSRQQQDSNQSSSDDMMSITLFPACGKTQCSSPRDCIPRIAENYHFLIVSLKPDCCQSAYELIYDAFKYNVVPVVLAPPNATLQVPQKSVVSSSQLQNPGELAAHLRDLLNDRTSYESYFAWKEDCPLASSDEELCPLCRALWATPAHYRHRHSNLQEWWNRGLNCVSQSLYGLDKGFTLRP